MTNLLTQLTIVHYIFNILDHESIKSNPYRVYKNTLNCNFIQIPINFSIQPNAVHLFCRFIKNLYKHLHLFVDQINERLSRDLDNQEITEEKELINSTCKECFKFLNQYEKMIDSAKNRYYHVVLFNSIFKKK